MFKAALSAEGQLSLQGEVTLDNLVAATRQLDQLLGQAWGNDAKAAPAQSAAQSGAQSGAQSAAQSAAQSEAGASTSLVVDLTQVQTQGAAILVLLVHVCRFARRHGLAVSFHGAPSQLVQLASTFGLQQLPGLSSS